MYYGWIVTIAGFLMSAIGIGARYSYGIFFKSLEMEFGLSRAATSGIFSFYMLLCSIVAITGGWAQDKYGPRKVGIFIGIFTGMSFLLSSVVTASWQLLITYSLLLALGTGAIYGMVNSTVARWFVTKRGLAIGLSSSGGGIGMIFISPIASYLIIQFSWRTAYFIIGIAATVIILITAVLLKRDPGEIGLLPDGAKTPLEKGPVAQNNRFMAKDDLSLAEVFKTRQFWQIGLVWLFVSIGLHLVMVHVVPYAVGLGISAMQAAFVMSLIGLMNLISRLPLGKLSDSFGRKTISVACTLIQCSILIWLVWARVLWMMIFFAVVFGLMWGGIGTLMTALVGDIFGTSRLGTIMGVTSAMWGIGAAIGPELGGVIFDVTGSYFTAFGLAALGLLVASFLMGTVKPLPEKPAAG